MVLPLNHQPLFPSPAKVKKLLLNVGSSDSQRLDSPQSVGPRPNIVAVLAHEALNAANPGETFEAMKQNSRGSVAKEFVSHVGAT
jgi:hypothetical protein